MGIFYKMENIKSQIYIYHDYLLLILITKKLSPTLDR